MVSPKAIAFYLPQYHPIPENDAWWGKGFTEWRNVVNARRRFSGHYQPHLPSELGFYDLRLPEAREAQAKLASQFGIHGFCYYHYWFNGRRILERPFQEVFELGEPSLPFCLCWANENWSRRWDGSEDEILLRQDYHEEDDIAHIQSLIPCFSDPRYIRIEDKPVFLVYKTSDLPNPRRTAAQWRSVAKNNGLKDLYLILVESRENNIIDPRIIGFDASLEFQPCWPILDTLVPKTPSLRERLIGKWQNESPGKKVHHVFDYDSLCHAALARPLPSYLRFPCVTPSWDNTARRKWGGVVLENSTPELYGDWLDKTIARMETMRLPEPLIFINAWNEWAEGNHLEPDQRWGTGYLEQTLRALQGAGG